MTKEQFTEALRRSLREHRERFPHARAEDVVKFVFQGYLGVGHLLGEPARVEERIAEEMSREQASPKGALTEDLGILVRTALRRPIWATPAATFSSAPPACFSKTLLSVIRAWRGGERRSMTSPMVIRSNSLFSI